MNPLTKMALGLIGQLRPEPPTGDGSPVLALPPPRQGGGLPHCLHVQIQGYGFGMGALALEEIAQVADGVLADGQQSGGAAGV